MTTPLTSVRFAGAYFITNIREKNGDYDALKRLIGKQYDPSPQGLLNTARMFYEYGYYDHLSAVSCGEEISEYFENNLVRKDHFPKTPIPSDSKWAKLPPQVKNAFFLKDDNRGKEVMPIFHIFDELNNFKNGSPARRALVEIQKWLKYYLDDMVDSRIPATLVIDAKFAEKFHDKYVGPHAEESPNEYNASRSDLKKKPFEIVPNNPVPRKPERKRINAKARLPKKHEIKLDTSP